MLNWSYRVYAHKLDGLFNVSRVIHMQGDISIEVLSGLLFSPSRISPRTLIFLEAPASLYLDPMAILQVILTLLLTPIKERWSGVGGTAPAGLRALEATGRKLQGAGSKKVKKLTILASYFAHRTK
jgi:hypothetical protein